MSVHGELDQGCEKEERKGKKEKEGEEKATNRKQASTLTKERKMMKKETGNGISWIDRSRMERE